jgi:hypothetical protein
VLDVRSPASVSLNKKYWVVLGDVVDYIFNFPLIEEDFGGFSFIFNTAQSAPSFDKVFVL